MLISPFFTSSFVVHYLVVYPTLCSHLTHTPINDFPGWSVGWGSLSQGTLSCVCVLITLKVLVGAHCHKELFPVCVCANNS